MTEFLKKLRRSANPCEEASLPESGYYKGTPLGEDSDLFREHIEGEKKKVMGRFATSELSGYGSHLSDMVHRSESTVRASSRYAMMDEVSPAEVMKKMARLAESIHSSSYEKVGLYGWFAESKHDAPNFFERSEAKPEAKPKAKPKSAQADIPLTQTDMVW